MEDPLIIQTQDILATLGSLVTLAILATLAMLVTQHTPVDMAIHPMVDIMEEEDTHTTRDKTIKKISKDYIESTLNHVYDKIDN